MGNRSSLSSSRSWNSRPQPSALPQPRAPPQPLALPQPHLRPLSTPGSTPPHKRFRGAEDDDLQDEDSGDLNDLGQDVVIGTNYQSVEEVQRHLMMGFEKFNLILGIDCTKSNMKRGRRSFRGRSLHATGPDRNPYETVLNITGRTLSLFEGGERMINCFGFGEETTRDHSVFSFRSDRPCEGMAEVLTQYRALISHLRFAEPTSFAPIINAAVNTVERSDGNYHILLIIAADGPVKRHAMQATADAIVNASRYPLSIVVVGVGDGPWNKIDAFVEKLPDRQFDNFHFVNFTDIMQSNQAPHLRDAEFAATLVKEIPSQCRAIMEKRLMEMCETSPSVQVLPPPSAALDMDRQACRHLQPPQMSMSNLLASIPHDLHPRGTPHTAPDEVDTDEVDTEQICGVCCIGSKDTLFNCGHQVCYCCSTADRLKLICPFCRAPIETRIPLMPPGGIKSTSLEDIQEALQSKGLGSVKLIVGIDFAKHAPAGLSLHTIGRDPNAVEQALTTVGRMFLPFLEDNPIYSFGFGDPTTQENRVFSFFSDHRPCKRMGEVLTRYRAMIPHISGAGRSSFEPVINAAVGKVEESDDGRDHILVIVTDNQVEDSVSAKTKNAILNASSYPLSIVLVGVGDGPWNMMTTFADNLPARPFNNFHFVSLTQIMRSSLPPHVREAQFAAAVVKGIPSQYKADPKTERVGTYSSVGPLPLPPPPEVLRMDAQASQAPTVDADSSGYRSTPRVPQMPTSAQLALTVHRPNPRGNAANSYTNFRAPGEDNTECILCATRTIDMALGCGHQVLCSACATGVDTCPSCWARITTRVRLY